MMMEKMQVSNDFRLALALAIVKGRGRSAVAEQEGHWKKKAKLYKQELKALRQQVQDSEESDTLDKLPALAPCDCLFLSGGLQNMQNIEFENSLFGDKHMSKLSVQLFLRNVRRLSRAKQRKKATCPTDLFNSLIPRDVGLSLVENLKGHLALVLQFIMDLLCDAQTISKTKQFSAYIHHSVKFIKESIPQLLDKGANEKHNIAEMVKGLTSGLCLKLINYSSDGEDSRPDARVWIQRASYQLGSLPFLGQQFLFQITKLIAEVAETLVFADPFHEGVAQTYDNLYFLFQLFEKLLSDYVCMWATAGELNIELLTVTLERHFSTVKYLARFANWASLIILYNNRLTGEIVAQLSIIASRNHCAEESQHTALLHLVEMAKPATLID